MLNSENFVLYTKLNRPTVGSDFIVRPRLLTLLDAGTGGALTLVVAPAGFGKTALISSWVETLVNSRNGTNASIPTAWLSLDDDDNDLRPFLHYFINALQTLFPDSCAETLNLLNAVNKPSSTLLAATLNNEIERLPSRFILVLDDLQALHNPAIFDLLAAWLRHWPRTMHLVILSRLQPPLPLADLRARGQLTEIRSRDLRFTPTESAAYLRSAVSQVLDEEILALLQQRMEGWITGLKLATLSLVRHSDPPALAQAMFDDGLYITDYLLDQVLDQQPPDMQQFLLVVAIPDRFCASLAEALVNGRSPASDAQALMASLETADLFITALDNRREWYRFHDMFRDFLQQRGTHLMSTDEIQAVHLHAANWHARHGPTDQALHHALQAGDLHLAAQIMQQGLLDVLNREDRPTLERWLQLLPEEFVLQNPHLQVMRAWETIFRCRIDHFIPA